MSRTSYSLELTWFMSELAVRFEATANYELPQVKLDLAGFTVTDTEVSLMGTVDYNSDTLPIELTLPYTRLVDARLDLSTYAELFPAFVGVYYRELKSLYGVDFAKEFPPTSTQEEGESYDN